MADPELPPLSRDDLKRIVDTLRERLSEFHPDLPEYHRVRTGLTSMWSGFTAPFDWPAWIKEKGGESWAGSLETLATADLTTIRRLVTAHIRINRFVDGHFDSLLKKGYLNGVYERLEQLLEEEEST